jgi:hypothetical protein
VGQVVDLHPGQCCGSGIRCFFTPRIRDGAMVGSGSGVKHPGSATLIRGCGSGAAMPPWIRDDFSPGPQHIFCVIILFYLQNPFFNHSVIVNENLGNLRKPEAKSKEKVGFVLYRYPSF